MLITRLRFRRFDAIFAMLSPLFSLRRHLMPSFLLMLLSLSLFSPLCRHTLSHFIFSPLIAFYFLSIAILMTIFITPRRCCHLFTPLPI